MIKKEKINLNIDELILKLCEKLKESGWYNILKGFLLSEDFKKILITLQDNVNDGKRFTPPLSQIFKCFEECPYDTLNTIIIGEDPYTSLDYADGLLLSSGNTKKFEMPLRVLLKAINDDVYNGKKDPLKMDTDLKRLSHQGILLLNSSLTSEIHNDKISHYKIWEPLINYLIDMLNNNQDYTWILMGKRTWKYEDVINDDFILKCEHPNIVKNYGDVWNSNDIFNKINEKQVSKKLKKIIW